MKEIIRRHPVRFRIITSGGLALVLVASLIASYCGIIRYTGNFHVVEQGKLYRSGQLDESRFAQVISRYGVKSILNLRGAGPGLAWYDHEVSIANSLGVAHFDYGISASDVVTAAQLNEILAILRGAPKPILVHCQAGADRAGLVTALFLAEIDRKPLQEAARQLSLIYGHFPYLTSRTSAMDESYWRYVLGEATDHGHAHDM